MHCAMAVDFDGSGSTFVYPIMLKWAYGYNARTGVKVNYQAIGSGGGIQQVKAGRVRSARPTSPCSLKNSERQRLRSFLS
jgi:phosphate transport system substrate-binding protein